MDCPQLPWMINFHSNKDGTILNQQYDSAFATDYVEHLYSELPKKRLSSIICSIGPNITGDALENMLQSGMSIAVIKLAHCTLDQARELVLTVRKAVMNFSMKEGRVHSLGIGIDIKGPEIRVGKLKQGEPSEVELIEDMIYVNLKDTKTVMPGDKIHISNTNNGKISLSAQKIVGSIIRCLIENTGKFSEQAGVSVETALTIPLLSEEDKEAIEFCAQEKVSFIFIPYAEQADTITEIRRILGKQGKATMIISKIESTAGVYNIDNLIAVSDGILISRVALAAELTPEKVIIVQKMITGKCIKNGVPSILAPSVLHSMSTNSAPTNAEIADITSSITDGVDCFMLSRETTVGLHPIEAIKTLDKLCRTAEPLMFHSQMFHDLTQTVSPVEPLYAISISAVEAALKCNAAAIVVTTVTGRSAKLLARFRPRCPIIAITRYAHISRMLTMWRAIDPVHYIRRPESQWCKDLEKRVQFGLTHGKKCGYIKAGDALVIVMGSKMGTGFTNALKIVYASEYDTYG
ncbi:Pyruvate kinase, alpha/beta domain [Popillia japonica]|uniref:Pyruvate kinase n=1 Tax=Popillia japonica TaxID=7064 RepID=A0AAW1IA66_POPJA